MSTDPRVYGEDFQVSLRNLDLVRSPQAGLATVSGPDNVQGAVLRRLDTPLGNLPAHPEYGNPAWDLLGDPMVQGFTDRFLAATRQCLDQEPRISVIKLRIGIVAELGRVDVGLTYQLLGQPGERNLVWSVSLSAVRASIPA
jgi:phage baseplate assembly protein W